jgi:Ran GTPase-activating protein (RanGAP) involved in mRNA processing and transport
MRLNDGLMANESASRIVDALNEMFCINLSGQSEDDLRGRGRQIRGAR